MKVLIICCLVCLPLKNFYLTSSFGYRLHPVTGKYAFHSGIDLRAKYDTVFAIMDGYVVKAGFNRLLGINIRVDHSGTCWSEYGHLSRLLVIIGDTVKAGQPIGVSGATGRVTGAHLHFAIHCGQRYVDPLKFLNQFLILKNHE